MALRILLKSEGTAESVSAWNHVYPVKDGFVLVDVSPYLPDDATADAARDVAEICKQVGMVDVGGGLAMPTRMFRPANQGEIAAWQAAQVAARLTPTAPAVLPDAPEPPPAPAPPPFDPLTAVDAAVAAAGDAASVPDTTLTTDNAPSSSSAKKGS